MALPRTSWEDGTLPAAWQELAAHAGDKPWLRKLLTERRRVAQNPAPRLALIAWRYSLWKERLQRLRPGQRSRLQRRLGVSLAGAALLLALAAAPGLGAPVAAAPAAAITVTDGTGTIANDLSCSLPEAIINANANDQSGSTDCGPGALGLDIITLPTNTNVALTASHNSTYGPTGLPVVTSAITIEGNGNTISRSGGTFRIMAVGSGGDLTLNSATVSGGVASGSSPAYDGGGIYARSAALAVTNSTLSGNSATLGAGIWAHSATVTVSNSTLSGNLASNQGGGINAFLATVTVTNSTLSGNIASGFGGGIMAFAATVVVTNSTLSSNSGAQGGGIYAQSSPVTVTNSTLSGNSASSVGGGINVRFATLAVSNSTLSGNSASYFGGGIRALSVTVAISYSTLSGNSASTDGGIHHSAGTITLRSSIVALQTAGGDCNTTVTSGGYNIDSDSTCGFTGTGDQQGVSSGSLNLKPLANTGGPTETRALGYASVALDQIPFGVNGCGDPGQTDQRGILRPQDWGTNDSPDKCDVGAWEGKPNGPNAVTLAGLQATSGCGPAGLWGAALAGLGGLGLSAFLSRRRGRPTAAGDSAASTLAAAVQQGAPSSLRPSSVSSSTYTPPAITSRGRLRQFSGAPLAVDPNDPLHLSP